MKKTGDYYVIVVEDTNLGQIVATATLITEHKYIHACAKVNPTGELHSSDFLPSSASNIVLHLKNNNS